MYLSLENHKNGFISWGHYYGPNSTTKWIYWNGVLWASSDNKRCRLQSKLKIITFLCGKNAFIYVKKFWKQFWVISTSIEASSRDKLIFVHFLVMQLQNTEIFQFKSKRHLDKWSIQYYLTFWNAYCCMAECRGSIELWINLLTAHLFPFQYREILTLFFTSCARQHIF